MFGSLVIIMLNFQNCEIYKKANENIKIKCISKEKLYKIVSFTYEYLKNVYCQNIYSIVVLTKVFFWINIEYNRKNLT